MPYIVIENLSAGVDKRRPIYSSKQGSLWEGINGHLSRGGDFEKRKAFVETYDLTGLSTHGMQTVGTQVYVFGSVDEPVGLPAGVLYQKLAHPDGLAMSDISYSTLFDGKIYVIAEYSDGSLMHFYNGLLVDDWVSGVVRTGMTDNSGIASHLRDLIAQDLNYVASVSTDTVTIRARAAGTAFTISKAAVDGDGFDSQDITLTETVANVGGGTEVISTGTVTITSGSDDPSANYFLDLQVNGVRIKPLEQVPWRISNDQTAHDIAVEINDFTSVPNYTATVSGNIITIHAEAGTGAGPNGFAVIFSVFGTVTATATNMAGGAAGTANTAQTYTAQVTGTFGVGDKFSIILDDKVFGNQGNPASVSEFVETHDEKVYAGVGSLLQFSAVNTADQWNTDTDIGAGSTNLSNHDEGSTTLTGVSTYQGNLAVFTNKSIQIWFVEADDNNNIKLQTLRRTGTQSPGSIQSFGDTDVFYLDSTGVRSLRARDSSNNASVSDVGTLVDTLVQDWLSTLTLDEKKSIRSIIEPEDSRYWLAVKNQILVFSYFPGSKISGWTWYLPGFDVDWISDSGDNTGPYVRSADLIYKYGGADNATYDSSETTCWLPFLDAGKPGHFKSWESMDLMATNTWSTTLLTDPEELDKAMQIGSVNGFTLLEDHYDMVGHWPMVSPKLTCTAAGAASISSILLHYNLLESESDG